MIKFNKLVSRTLSMNKKLNDSAPCPCGQSDQHQSHALLPGAGRAVTDERSDNGKAQISGTEGEEEETTFTAYQEQKNKS